MVVVYDTSLFSSQLSVRCFTNVCCRYEVMKGYVDIASFSSFVKLSNASALIAGLRYNVDSSSSSLRVKAGAQDPLKLNRYAIRLEPKSQASGSGNGSELLPGAQGKQIKELRNSVPTLLGDDKGGMTASKIHKSGHARFVEDELIFRQNFLVRSYEVDYEQKASFEALMNYSQEANVNYMKCTGLVVSGFGVTPEMSSRDLIWVYSRMQVIVDCYPSWGDIVQAETKLSLLKSGIHFGCILTDGKTAKTLVRTSSFVVMINKHTRKLSKFIDAVKAEIQHFCRTCDPILDKYCRKLQKLEDGRADYVKRGLKTQWSDLDVNQHVNNVKFISWILEGTPASIRENHELCAMTVEFRKECGIHSKLESLSAVSTNDGGTCYNFDHLLQLENGAEIARARTTWRPKCKRSVSLGPYEI